MNKVVEVRLWGTTIAYLGYQPGQTQLATFEYTENFANAGIQIAPLTMPTPVRLYNFADISQSTFKGLPGIIADSLPDKFGNQLIDLFATQNEINPKQLTSLDRLLYIGDRGMGALEYHPAETMMEGQDRRLTLDLHTLAELATMVVSRDQNKQHQLLNIENQAQAIRLIRVGSSAGGARSKALIAVTANNSIKDGTPLYSNNHRYWIVKFDSENNQDRDHSDPKGMTRIEYIYAAIANECGINMPQTDYLLDGDDFHFMIERFDRIQVDDRTEKLHYASWCGINHAHRDTTGSFSYEQLIMTIRELGLGQMALTEIFKRAVFNIIGRNQDDHTKNFGFLMDKAGKWQLAPAFDLVYAYDPRGRWTKSHQISLAGKQSDFERSDLIKFALFCNINRKKANTIIDKTLDSFSRFEQKAREFDVSKTLLATVRDNQRMYL